MKPLLNKAATLLAVFFSASIATAQSYSPLRTPAGDPDLQGIWQVRNTASWDVQHHAASHDTPAGFGVVVDPPDGAIPYQPSALEKKKENFAKRKMADPVEKCYLAGVPRTMYSEPTRYECCVISGRNCSSTK